MNKILVGFVALAAAVTANAETFTIDIGHAEIGFSVKHMMVSNTKGKFNKFEGTVDYDVATKTLNSIQGSIDVTSIDTNNEGRDGHLNNEDFFDTAKHPKMTFASTSVKQTGDNTFEVTGNLNVLGMDREVVIPVTVSGPVDDPYGFKRIGLASTMTLNRRDLGITNSPAAMIGDEIKINIEAEATFK
jgi:polyisoprenoid-binding protein YceI